MSHLVDMKMESNKESELEEQNLINVIVSAIRADIEIGALLDVAENVATGARFLVAINSVRETEYGCATWVLMNLREHAYLRPDKSYLSSSWQQEFDWRNKRTRVRSLLNFSEHMGGGEIVGASMEMWPWEPLVPNSVDECVMQFLEENRSNWQRS